MKYEIEIDGESYEIEIIKEDGKFLYKFPDGEEGFVSLMELNSGEYFLKKGNENYHFYSYKKENGDEFSISHGNCSYEVKVSDFRKKILKKMSGVEENVNRITAPMPGKIVSIKVNEGDDVSKDSVLLVMEAMKMENLIKSPRSGKIKKVHVSSGDSVEARAILIEFFEEKS